MDEHSLRNASAHVIGHNRMALEAARAAADRLGFRAVVLASPDRGEVREVAGRYASVLRCAAASPRRGGPPLCFLGGGELTVAVRGKGQGGRNQEFVLAALDALAQTAAASAGGLSGADWLIASLGTDGIDGMTDAAGAWAGPATIAAARRQSLSLRRFLDDNDSHRFFERAGGLIVTGPTGTNVMDLRMMLLGSPDFLDKSLPVL